jgi:hypothetical protein
VVNLFNDLSVSAPATFVSTRFGVQRGRSFNRITAALPILPSHPFPTVISLPVGDPTPLLLDTPATLCPEEHGINNV